MKLYEKLFEYPVIQEPMLIEPSFSFIHMIFSIIMMKTGFGKGLFTKNELDVRNFESTPSIKSFEGNNMKLDFMTKAIFLTELALDETINLSPQCLYLENY